LSDQPARAPFFGDEIPISYFKNLFIKIILFKNISKSYVEFKILKKWKFEAKRKNRNFLFCREKSKSTLCFKNNELIFWREASLRAFRTRKQISYWSLTSPYFIYLKCQMNFINKNTCQNEAKSAKLSFASKNKFFDGKVRFGF